MPPPPLALSLQFARFDGAAAHRAALPRHRVARWLRAALGEEVQAAEITVRIVDAGEGRQINSDYRDKDYATNVLSFPAELPKGVPLPILGDLVLCAPVIAREAEEQGKPLKHHYAHMLVHGVLHLLGHDHTDEAEAEAMEAIEREVLAGLGIPDPYA